MRLAKAGKPSSPGPVGLQKVRRSRHGVPKLGIAVNIYVLFLLRSLTAATSHLLQPVVVI
jgi:hypothetical protein